MTCTYVQYMYVQYLYVYVQYLYMYVQYLYLNIYCAQVLFLKYVPITFACIECVSKST